jgi:geranylgeranylglycerol-phosphate geranylgeranyltransferase
VAALRAIFQLTRLETSLLGFFAIFIPFFTRNHDLYLSFSRAVPLLFISVCTFVANDLDDMERDRVNHPDRPLPGGHLSPVFVVICYFTFLALALFSTSYFIPSGIDFLYYSAISLSISYGYISEYIPILKPPYVAIAATVPILIVATSYPKEPRLYLIAGSVFLITLGREICMDIKDRAGDPVSFMHRFRPKALGKVAFSLQAIGLLLLVILINKGGDIIALVVMSLLLVISALCWFQFESYKLSLIVMKIQLFVGLYFLI